MRYTSFLAFMLISCQLFGQNRKMSKLPSQSIEANIGMSRNGSGDGWGPMFGFQYSQYFTPHLLWDAALNGTIHDGSEPLFYKEGNGNTVDGSYRWAIGGMQASGHIGYALIRSAHHELIIKGGGLLRYQSSSYFDQLEIVYPEDLPYPAIVLNNTSPMRTLAVGASVQLQYNYVINEKISIGIVTGLQTDTNGDMILIPALLSVGRKF